VVDEGIAVALNELDLRVPFFFPKSDQDIKIFLNGKRQKLNEN